MAALSESRAFILDRLYPREGTHGKPHAEKTEQLCQEIVDSSYFRGKISARDRELVRMGALGHDAGYPEREAYWSGIQYEHVFESVKRMDELLKQLSGFTAEEAVLIKLLIFNHDNTNYIFPAWETFESSRRGLHTIPYGRPELGPAVVNPLPGTRLGEYNQIDILYSDRFRTLLSILQEADSRLGDAKRTLQFAESRNIPLANEYNGVVGVGMPMWQHSGCASALLAAQRALLDAQTPEGKRIAWKLFTDTRQIIKDALHEEGVKTRKERPWATMFHVGDNVGELLRIDDVRRLIFAQSPKDRLQRLYPLVRLEQAYPLETIDQVPETGIHESWNTLSILMDTAKLRIIRPVSEESVSSSSLIREAIIGNYAIDILSTIPGALRLALNYGDFMHAQGNTPFTFCPPVIRTPPGSFSQQMFERSSYEVYQGERWVALAQTIGLPKIRVIFDKSFV